MSSCGKGPKSTCLCSDYFHFVVKCGGQVLHNLQKGPCWFSTLLWLLSSLSVKNIKDNTLSQFWRQRELLILCLINDHELIAYNVSNIKFSAETK